MMVINVFLKRSIFSKIDFIITSSFGLQFSFETFLIKSFPFIKKKMYGWLKHTVYNFLIKICDNSYMCILKIDTARIESYIVSSLFNKL